MENKYHYNVICESLFHPDIGTYTTYGIKVTSNDPSLPAMIISDVSVSEKEVENLVEKCYNSKLEPRHILDVVEDYLEE